MERRRILIVGDSIAFGSGLDVGERFSEVLGRELGDSVEVVNAGVPGWGNDREMLFYELRLRRLKPDVVILSFTGNNDVVNNALGGALLEERHQAALRAGRGFTPHDSARSAARPGPVDAHEVAAAQQPAPGLHCKRRLMRVSYRHRSGRRPRSSCTGSSRTARLALVGVRKSSRRCDERGLECDRSHPRAADDCRADSARFIVFAMPLKLEVDDAWREQVIKGTNADARIDMAYPYRRLHEFCAAHHIEYYYPVDEFRRVAAHETLYFEKDSHPNIRGNQITADYLRDVLTGSVTANGTEPAPREHAKS